MSASAILDFYRECDGNVLISLARRMSEFEFVCGFGHKDVLSWLLHVYIVHSLRCIFKYAIDLARRQISLKSNRIYLVFIGMRCTKQTKNCK